MESPKQQIKVEMESNSFSTPSTSTLSDDERVIVTPGSTEKSDKSTENPRPIIEEPHDHDVLCGRGGSINSHPGNERFRQLVEKKKRVYLTARFKREKRLIANGVLSEIRSLKPPGRFLAKDSKTGNWHDIGDEKARDKTSQALRENAPSIRAEIEVEINQQRAEMQRAEEEEAAYAASGHPQQYYQQSWGGYYAPHHRYGRYQTESPRYGNHERYDDHWHDRYPDGERSSNHNHSSMASRSDSASMASRSDRAHGHHGHPYYAEDQDHSMHSSPETERISQIPSSNSSWTGSRRGYEYHDQVPSSKPPPATKSLHYVHQCRSHEQVDHRDGRRMVHFEDDGRYPRNSPRHYDHQRKYNSGNEYYSHSSPANGYREKHYVGESRSHEPSASANAVTPESSARKPRTSRRDDEAIQPHPTTYDGDQGSSLLSQVANHIMGSWDTSMICTNSSIEDAGLPNSKHGPCTFFNHDPPHVSLADAMEDEEGQEVELVEIMDCKEDGFEKSAEHEDYDDIRVPPPDGNNMPPPPRRIEIDWPSKMTGCNSNWLPETFNPPSFFTQKSNPLSPSTSMDMDESAVGTEGISCTGSVGGASLCQVFSHEQIADGEGLPSPSNVINHQVLTQMPSWERSVRSKSPSTVCSDSSVVDNREIPVATSKSNVVGDTVTSQAVSPKSNNDVRD
eukprot:CAMPEP_0178910832 /NCGR_PEP_ID=MMETSP0786-20121207/9321_1 /TAXON_ID=186022 /ORGANISM="Thalassionema frauenfeldii, Strain CCMP 1798" /LENGTH=678 /DNA_ID=CAMNT_0020583137 /DNA_START=148 /DNA_END=2181 /DNA_ORIENTATION=-